MATKNKRYEQPQESATEPSSAPPSGPDIPQDEGLFDSSGWEQKGLSPILKPSAIHPGSAYIGLILRGIKSPQASIKSPLIEMERYDHELHPTGEKFCLPATAVISVAFGATAGECASVEQIDAKAGYLMRFLKTANSVPPVKGKGKHKPHIFQVWLKKLDEGGKRK